MSETIFLEPSSERTVFLQIKNTSDKNMSALQGRIFNALRVKGYDVVNMPSMAHYSGRDLTAFVWLLWIKNTQSKDKK